MLSPATILHEKLIAARKGCKERHNLFLIFLNLAPRPGKFPLRPELKQTDAISTVNIEQGMNIRPGSGDIYVINEQGHQVPFNPTFPASIKKIADTETIRLTESPVLLSSLPMDKLETTIMPAISIQRTTGSIPKLTKITYQEDAEDTLQLVQQSVEYCQTQTNTTPTTIQLCSLNILVLGLHGVEKTYQGAILEEIPDLPDNMVVCIC